MWVSCSRRPVNSFPNLKPANFRVYENGVEQKVTGFKRVEAPITALLLCEFASTSYYFLYDMRNAAWSFAEQLRPQDYVALMTFDMRTQIVTDFTQDKRQLYNALNSLVIPGFSERNVFDALYEAEDRLSRIEGRKYIILIASGRDTFSKITLGQDLPEGQEHQGHHDLYGINWRSVEGDGRRPKRQLGRPDARH